MIRPVSKESPSPFVDKKRKRVSKHRQRIARLLISANSISYLLKANTCRYYQSLVRINDFQVVAKLKGHSLSLFHLFHLVQFSLHLSGNIFT